MKNKVSTGYGKSTTRRVTLLIETASGWSRQTLSGIAKYAHGDWDISIDHRGLLEPLKLPSRWQGDGIIARVDRPELFKAIQKTKVPAVNVSWLCPHTAAIPSVMTDEAACGELAARHFLDHGFRHFGYVGPIDRPGYVDEMGPKYRKMITAADFECLDYPRIASKQKNPTSHTRRKFIVRWLKKLPQPIGILVWSDGAARDVLAAAIAANLSVPDDVAVICGEHDPLMSTLASIPLSCINTVQSEVGYQAAALLDRMMNGEKSPKLPTLIAPAGVVQRRSTDTYAIEDSQLAKAMRFIRDHASGAIGVIDVLRHLGCSRRMLEQRFSKHLNRTPATEIRRVRLKNTQRLLLETELAIPQIAERTGFVHAEVLIRNFRKEFGTSPGRYRKKHH